METYHRKREFLAPVFFVLLLLNCSGLFAQTPNSVFGETEFEVEISTESRWSYMIGLGSRSLFFTKIGGEKIENARQEHLEINQFTTYAAAQNVAVSLGLRYRFNEIFDDSEYNEFRVIEQVEIAHPNSFFNLEHRVRAEQRYEGPNTEHRLRYEIGFSRPISEEFSLGFLPELLYSISSGAKPEPEYRLELELENSSIKNLDLEIGFEYRRENFSIDPENEFFIMTGATLSL